MKTKWKAIFEADGDEENSVEDNFDFPEDEGGEPAAPAPEEEEEIPDNMLKDPTFKFEVRGNFEYKELEKIIAANRQGLTGEKVSVIIKTLGSINDSEYEDFIGFMEDKLPLTRFEG